MADDSASAAKSGFIKVEDEPISKKSINKYDTYTLKATIDEEIVDVSNISSNTCQMLEFRGF